MMMVLVMKVQVGRRDELKLTDSLGSPEEQAPTEGEFTHSSSIRLTFWYSYERYKSVPVSTNSVNVVVGSRRKSARGK